MTDELLTIDDIAKRVDILTLSRISRHKDLRILSNTYYRATAEEIAASL